VTSRTWLWTSSTAGFGWMSGVCKRTRERISKSCWARNLKGSKRTEIRISSRVSSQLPVNCSNDSARSSMASVIPERSMRVSSSCSSCGVVCAVAGADSRSTAMTTISPVLVACFSIMCRSWG